MPQIANTLPEPRHQSIKKRVAQPANDAPSPLVQTQEQKPKAEKAKSDKKPGAAIASWWPVGVGIFLSGFAPEWYSMLSQAGEWPVRLAFPLVLVATHRDVGMGASAPQMALFLQLPIEGLITKLSLSRGISLKSALAQLILIHLVSAFVLWLVSFAH